MLSSNSIPPPQQTPEEGSMSSPRAAPRSGRWRTRLFHPPSFRKTAGFWKMLKHGWLDYCCCCVGGGCCNGERHTLLQVYDDDALNLSHVGQAAYECLRWKHAWHHHSLWNVTSGIYRSLDATPTIGAGSTEHHSDWFPAKLGEMIARTEIWCDVLSLGPPDGQFLTAFQSAIQQLHDKHQPIVVRIMFGNIVGMPVNCTAVIRSLTHNIPPDTALKLWVGAWRKGVSWNHAKIIAIDGRYLHTGGHNLWDAHYLKHDPVHDLSIELEGRVAHDGHLYSNEQWKFVQRMQSTLCGYCIDKMPDFMPVALKSRVTVSQFPASAPVFPPLYRKANVPRYLLGRNVNQVPMITMGRYGALTHFRRRPSDDAFVAMIGAAKHIIRLALQDLGPVCIPGTKITLPGCVWPKAYLSALGRVIWEKGVHVEIILSNPNSIPGGLKATEANYGNGWSCVDVAAEIIKTIQKQFPSANTSELRQRVTENLRVCFLREAVQGQRWEDGKAMAMHAKHFIIDDVCAYVGSQNLYICDLAEWGVVIDSAEQTQVILDAYWNPLWKASYTPGDCDVQAVMDGLEIDRDGENPNWVSPETKSLMDQQKVMSRTQLLVAGEQGSVYHPSEGTIEMMYSPTVEGDEK